MNSSLSQTFLILSDTHGYIDESILKHCSRVDEVWHVGDIGSLVVVDKIKNFAPSFRAVYGNIDGIEFRSRFPEHQFFTLHKHRILMLHICGYPGKYTKRAKELISKYKPTLLLGGHSHILKIKRDSENNLLFINPGAAGKEGFHVMQTMILLRMNSTSILQISVVELGKRAAL